MTDILMFIWGLIKLCLIFTTAFILIAMIIAVLHPIVLDLKLRASERGQKFFCKLRYLFNIIGIEAEGSVRAQRVYLRVFGFRKLLVKKSNRPHSRGDLDNGPTSEKESDAAGLNESFSAGSDSFVSNTDSVDTDDNAEDAAFNEPVSPTGSLDERTLDNTDEQDDKIVPVSEPDAGLDSDSCFDQKSESVSESETESQIESQIESQSSFEGAQNRSCAERSSVPSEVSYSEENSSEITSDQYVAENFEKPAESEKLELDLQEITNKPESETDSLNSDVYCEANAGLSKSSESGNVADDGEVSESDISDRDQTKEGSCESNSKSEETKGPEKSGAQSSDKKENTEGFFQKIRNILKNLKRKINKKLKDFKGYIRLFMHHYKKCKPAALRFWRRFKRTVELKNGSLFVAYALPKPYLTGMMFGVFSGLFDIMQKLNVNFILVPCFTGGKQCFYSKTGGRIVLRPFWLLWALFGLLLEFSIYDEYKALFKLINSKGKKEK